MIHCAGFYEREKLGFSMIKRRSGKDAPTNLLNLSTASTA
jgi:hypothetical protein